LGSFFNWKLKAFWWTVKGLKTQQPSCRNFKKGAGGKKNKKKNSDWGRDVNPGLRRDPSKESAAGHAEQGGKQLQRVAREGKNEKTPSRGRE